MIIAGIIVAYVLIGIVTSKLLYNSLLNEMYETKLAEISRQRTSYGSETLEEVAFRCAKQEVDDQDSTIFWVGLGGWFWPVTAVIAMIFILWEACSWIAAKVNLLQSSSERKVKKAVAEKNRKQLLDQQEQDLKDERKRLKELAQSLEIATDGLDDEL